MGTKRKQRMEQFLGKGGSGAIVSFSQELSTCALSELQLALADRETGVYRTVHNHYSPHSAGCVVLVVTALDVWLNEAIHFLDKFGRGHLLDLAAKPTVARFEALLREFTPDTTWSSADLQLATDVRDEIVHHLPRVISEPGNVPSWLCPLQERGVFMSVSEGPGEFVLGQKLCSYGLAYWVFRIAERAVQELLAGLPEKERPHVGYGAGQFSSYRRVVPPEQLAEFDVTCGLERTGREF